MEFWKITGLSIFGLSVILTYTFSTLYHSLYFTKAKSVLKKLDQSSIYLLIAGTYTPFILVFLRNQLGLTLLLVVWSVSLMGIAYKVLFIFRKKKTEQGKLQLLVYLILGWISILLIGPILSSMPVMVVLFLILGGCFYTIGTIFIVWKNLKFNHSVWHLFVLLGTFSQFLALVYI